MLTDDKHSGQAEVGRGFIAFDCCRAPVQRIRDGQIHPRRRFPHDRERRNPCLPNRFWRPRRLVLLSPATPGDLQFIPPVQVFTASPPSWLTVQDAATLLSLPALHAGETAAISLAVE